jgi:hypothetical protein
MLGEQLGLAELRCGLERPDGDAPSPMGSLAGRNTRELFARDPLVPAHRELT